MVIVTALEPLSGEYVVYKDETWREPTWVGFLYYDANTYGAFLKTPNASVDVGILFRTELLDGELVLVGQQIITQISNQDVLAVNYLMGLLPDLYAWHVEALGGVKNKKSQTITKNSSVFGGSISLEFSSDIPVFGLKIVRVPNQGNAFILEKTGLIRDSNDNEFFDFSSLGSFNELNKKQVNFILDNKKTDQYYEIDGALLKLDDRWTRFADNVFVLENVGVILVDTINLKENGIQLETFATSLTRLFSFSTQASWKDPLYTKVQTDKTKTVIENLVYDISSQSLNRDRKICKISEDGESCLIVSITVDDAVWQANSSYFEKIY